MPTDSPAVPPAEGRLVVAATLLDSFEADLVAGALKDLRIDHVIRSDEDAAFKQMFDFHEGWGVVLARAQDVAEVLRVVEDLRASDADAAAAAEAEFER